MAQTRVIKASMLAVFFKHFKTQLEKGENSFSSGKVSSVKFDSTLQPAILKGNVMSSWLNRTYSVELLVDLEDGILEGSCSCPRSEVICHHMAALALHGYYNNITVTEKPCIDEVQGVLCLDEIFPSDKPNFRAVSRQATAKEISTFREILNSEKVGFSWFLSPEVVSDVD